MSAYRSLLILALAFAALVPAWGRQEHPQGWKVETRSSVIAAKAGVYSFTVTVRDGEGRLVNDAQVSLRVPPFGKGSARLVDARRFEDGRYWATVSLRPDYQRPRDVATVVTTLPPDRQP